MIEKIINNIFHPSKLLLRLDRMNFIRLSDKKYIEYLFKNKMGYKLDLNHPKKFDEKLQWLKLHDRKQIYTTMVDKYEAKEYVANIIGNEYIIKTLGVYDKFEEIDFSKLPNKFVIKCTHDSGGLVICKDKSKLNIMKAKKKINKSLKTNYYYIGREWPYKNVKPRIIVEEYMEDKIDKELIDYKLYCFNGKCDYVMACFDRFKGKTKFVFFDRNWTVQKEMSNDGIKYGDNIKLRKPKNLKLMFEFASKLSKGIPFVRVDFYETNGKLYFGELTFYPNSGFDKNRKEITDNIFSNQLNLKEYEENRILNK